MEVIERTQFEKIRASYRRLVLVKTFKNGSEDYSYECDCPRCMGKGIVYTHVLNGHPVPAIPDSGVCWRCLGSRTVTGKIHVVSDEAILAAREKAQAKAEKARQELINKRIEKGYKRVDFEIADWFHDSNVSLFKNGYYCIEKETEKAVLISFVNELDIFSDYSIWMPKKAIVR